MKSISWRTPIAARRAGICTGAACASAQPTIVTRGQAIVTARPDRAFVTIAAESRSRVSAEAQKQNAAAMTAVLQKIEQAGVPKDAIRTIGYDLHPEFDYANGRQTFRNFLARNTVEVTARRDRSRRRRHRRGCGRRRDDDYRASASMSAIAPGSSATRCARRSPMHARAPMRRPRRRRDHRSRRAGGGRGRALRASAADDADGGSPVARQRADAGRALDDRDSLAGHADRVAALMATGKRGREQFSSRRRRKLHPTPFSAMTADDMARARRMLMRRDPVLAPIIRKYGACGIKTGRESDIFCGLVEAIVSQQLSTRAAATIYGRLRALLPDGGPPTPEALHAAVG